MEGANIVKKQKMAHIFTESKKEFFASHGSEKIFYRLKSKFDAICFFVTE